MIDSGPEGFLAGLQRRGVLRVAASYAVIAWLLLQIADVTFELLRQLVTTASTPVLRSNSDRCSQSD